MDDNRITVYKGMRDFPPETMLKRNYVVSLIRDVFESYGFEPIETPAVEHWETLSGKYGEDEKLIYNFTDWGERRVGLRYDLTVPLARFVTNHLAQIPRPFKRYQIQPVWRADKPQKGRYREFYQCDIDTVGTPLLTADAEILKALSVVLIRLGFQGFLIQYNSRKIFPALTATLKTGVEGERSLARALDKLDKIGREGVREELLRYGFSPDQADRMDELLALEGKTDEKLSHLKRTLCEGPEKELFLKEIQELREAFSLFSLDEEHLLFHPFLARGLDYYTGPIFETTVVSPRVGSLTGGGRYDNLIGRFSGQSIPAVGSSIGLERIITVMDELRMYPFVKKTLVQALMAFPDDRFRRQAVDLAEKLRSQNLRIEVYLGKKDLRGQISYALSKGIPYILLLGEDEAAKNQVAVKDLQSATQISLPQEEAAAFLREKAK